MGRTDKVSLPHSWYLGGFKSCMFLVSRDIKHYSFPLVSIAKFGLLLNHLSVSFPPSWVGIVSLTICPWFSYNPTFPDVPCTKFITGSPAKHKISLLGASRRNWSQLLLMSRNICFLKHFCEKLPFCGFHIVITLLFLLYIF